MAVKSRSKSTAYRQNVQLYKEMERGKIDPQDALETALDRMDEEDLLARGMEIVLRDKDTENAMEILHEWGKREGYETH